MILTVEAFMKKRLLLPVIDVRTPAEYNKGHVPGAHNVPIFTNDERAEIGTIYKQQSRDEAVMRGLELVGPKLAGYVRKSREVAPEGEVLVHCWRGGMRSSSFAWLLDTAGLHADTLEGGYKAYRHFVREEFTRPLKICILGGMTGCGKTDILHILREKGEQVLDLEGLASHKGSGFGFINQGEQPTSEQFENDTYEVWQGFDAERTVWIEDESKKIGKVVINEPLFEQMRHAPVIKVTMPKELRIARLEKEYCVVPPDVLTGVIHKIRKRLGPQRTQKAIDYISRGEYGHAIDVVLEYYDKGYLYGMNKRDADSIRTVVVANGDLHDCVAAILDK